jgi:type II secretory pathway component PulF
MDGKSSRLLRSLETARFAYTLAILVAGGTPLLRALDTADGVRARSALIGRNVPECSGEGLVH